MNTIESMLREHGYRVCECGDPGRYWHWINGEESSGSMFGDRESALADAIRDAADTLAGEDA